MSDELMTIIIVVIPIAVKIITTNHQT